jgi:hypothetical protein
VPKTPDTPKVQVDDCAAFAAAHCVPDAPATKPPGGGGELPFTGPGDVLLALLLASLAGAGGMLLLAGASGREELDGLNRRTLASPSGFKLAHRELVKQQVGRD